MTGAQLDRIEVTGIRGWGHHGVLAAEKELGQEFSADVTLWLSTGPAGRADRLSRTVNYADVVADVHAEISTGSHDLLETLAERRSEEHTSELQSRGHLVCRLLLDKKNCARS